MIPITRKENYLNEIVGWGETAPEKPLTPEEFFFAAILGEAVQTPEPLNRYQIYLAKIAGRNISVPKPLTRIEFFLAKACGMDIETPTPITREEIFWSNYSAIVDFEVEGVPPLAYKAIEGTLENYRIYGNTVGGESVGDLVESGEHAGEYNVPVTVKGKNLYEITKFANDSVSQTVGGITFTISNNKVIYSGTSTAQYPQVLSPETPLIPGQSYYAKIIVKGSYEGQVYIFFRGSQVEGGTKQSYIRINPGTEEVFTAWYNTNVLYVAQGNNKHFDASIEVVITKVPSVTTPLYLPEPIKMVGDEADYIDFFEQKMHKVRKNLLPVVATSKTVTGVTFTVNVDKSVTCNGTNRGTSDIIFEFNQSGISLEIGRTYIVSGCPEGGAMVGSYVIKCYHGTSYGSSWVYDIGHGAAFPALGNGIARPQIIIPRGVTVNNLTFYPMIRTANIEDDTYEPYIENTDLDVTLPALPIIAGTNILTVGTEVQPSKLYIKGKKERE